MKYPPRWMRAIFLLAAISTATDLPPFVWGDWPMMGIRAVCVFMAWLMAYMAVGGKTEEEG